MVEGIGDGAVTVSVIGNPVPANPIPESEMDALLLGRTKELVAASPGQRNWRGIFIALLVIAAVLGLIVFSIFLLSPEDEGSRIKGRRMTLSDINGNGLKWRPFNGSWINDEELVYRDPTGGLSILNVRNLTVRMLMTNTTFRQLNAQKFIVSPDINFVVLLSDLDEDSARYSVYEVKTRNNFPLSPKDGVRDVPKLQYMLWAPNNVKKAASSGIKDGNPSQAIAFVYENDLYYKPKVQNDLVCRVTTTGKRGLIYNGIPDWFYANTPDLKSETIAFSADGSYLSFLSFNDTNVNEYKYSFLGDNNSKYPQIKTIRYPKALTRNPNVTVNVVDLSVLKPIKQIQIQSPIEGNDSYVGNMIWLSATDLSITYTNREQTIALTVLCQAPLFQCREAHTETITENGWVLAADKPIFSKTESYFKQANHTEEKMDDMHDLKDHEFKNAGFMLKRLPVRDGEHGYYRHVVFVSTSDMRTVPLTMGRFEVTEIIGWDEANEVIYFMATPPTQPGQRHLYKINLKLNITEKPNRIYVTPSQPECLTCDNKNFKLQPLKNGVETVERTRYEGLVSPYIENPSTTIDPNPFFFEIDGGDDSDSDEDTIPNNCMYNKVYFSRDFSYYVQECLGPDSPSIYLVETATNMKTFVLNNGDLLRHRISQLAIPQIRTFSVEIRHGFHAQVRLFLPPGMKEEEDIAFPLILHIDTAPGSQLVSEKFEVDWNWYACSQKAMIVAQIDARGSGFQGELLRNQIKSKLGTVEIEDQLGVLMYLRDNLKFVDPARICAYGWGYGGYAATMVLAEDSQRILECALAINPIVSFGYHNSFFTERYMPPGDDYLRALQESDLSMRAGNIDSRNFLLMHGTADTLVHQQHSLMLAKTLIDQGVGFRHQVYTDEGHQLSGVSYHLYKTIDWFLDESFGPLETNDWEPTGFFAFKQ